MKKNLKTIVIFIVLWLAAVIACSLFLVERGLKNDGFTDENAFAAFSDHVYVTDNAHGQGLLYMLPASGGTATESIFSTKGTFLDGFRIVDVDTRDEDLYTLYERRINDAGRLVWQYAVARQNESMQITALTPLFRLPMELELQGMDVEEDRVYLTALSSGGQQAYVYTVGLSSLVQITGGSSADQDKAKWESGATQVAEYMIQEAVRPRYLVQASYEDGTLQLRYDNSEPGYFVNDDTAKRLFEAKKLSVSQKVTVSGFDPAVTVITALAGLMLIILLAILMRERLRVVYAICIYEVLVIAALAGFFGVFLMLSRSVAAREYLRYETAGVQNVFDGYGNVDLTDPGFYNTADYETLTARIRRRLQEDTAFSNPTLDLYVVDVYTGNVILSAGGKNRGSITQVYGDAVLDFISPGIQEAGASRLQITHQGENLSLFKTNLLRSGYPDLTALSVTADQSLFEDTTENFGAYLQVLFLLFLLASLIGIGLLLWQSSDIRKLKTGLSRLARGDEIIKKPRVLGRDMNYLWNTVFEIQKNILSTNRVKFLTYEAYYRFAPKRIERILGKASITEVGVGDHAALKGTLTYVALPGVRPEQPGSMNRISALLQTVEELREEYDGILISQDVNLSVLRLLFLEDNGEAASFGTDLILRFKEDKMGSFQGACVVQQFTTYLYGVVGTPEEAEVYLSSKEGEFLASYAEWFASMALGQVITKQVMERLHHVGETRYIGFLLPDENDPENRLELYEVLDAQIPGTRKRRSVMKKKFSEALDLFYEQDFYFARNQFTEILRESPDDLLAKWYLFECEHYLDVAAPEGFTGALHKER